MDIVEPKKKQEYESVLPLINIVFLLLIFFMLAGAFTKPDMFAVEIPDAASNNDANRDDITLLMNANGELAIETTRYSKDELISLIKNKLDNKGVVVQLKADENVKSQDLIAMMETLSTTGLQSIRLLTVVNNDSPTQKPAL
jgi:biopolymer transport protein ExbD